MQFAHFDPLGSGDVKIYRVWFGKCIPWLAVRDSLMMQQRLQQQHLTQHSRLVTDVD